MGDVSGELTITSMPQGGYVVYKHPYDRGQIYVYLFASTTVDEALAFIKKTLRSQTEQINLNG